MKKKNKVILLIIDFVLLVLVIASLNDRVDSILPFNATPFLLILMTLSIVLAAFSSRKNK